MLHNNYITLSYSNTVLPMRAGRSNTANPISIKPNLLSSRCPGEQQIRLFLFPPTGMKYDIAAKPTNYNGRLYRSRLEARWAAFFNLENIRHEYEPFDFKGWSPDFLIHMDRREILVEVKPLIDAFDMANMLTPLLKSKEWCLMLCTANVAETLILFHNEFQLNLFNNPESISNWEKAANEVMFYKPTQPSNKQTNEDRLLPPLQQRSNRPKAPNLWANKTQEPFESIFGENKPTQPNKLPQPGIQLIPRSPTSGKLKSTIRIDDIDPSLKSK